MTLPNRRSVSERGFFKTYIFNLTLHFLILFESPFNFLLSILGSRKFIHLSEYYLETTEYARIKQEYMNALELKMEQHMESIRLAQQANAELEKMKLEENSKSRIDE